MKKKKSLSKAQIKKDLAKAVKLPIEDHNHTEVTVYLCGVDWQHEIGETKVTEVFRSVKALKERSECWEECGIVEVKVSFNKWIEKQTIGTKETLNWVREK